MSADRKEKTTGGPTAGAVTGRWQIPLLVAALGSLALAVVKLRPEPPAPTFEQLYAQVENLYKAELYPEADRRADEILQDPELPPEHRRRLKGLRARIIFAHEQGNSVHGVTNAENILINTSESLGEGETFDARTHYIRGKACEWLRRPEDALFEYRQAVEKGVENGWSVRKRIIEIVRAIGGQSSEELHAACDAFLEGDGVSDELRYWAIKQKVELYGLEDQPQQAEQLLAEQAEFFEQSRQRDEFEFLRSLSWYQLGRLDDAERLVRSLRDRITPGDEVYPGATWLLGRVLQDRDAPEYALGLYDELLGALTSGPYRTASMLGRAETMAALQRYDEAVEAYHETIRLAGDDPYGAIVDLVLIRESTFAWHQALLADGLGEPALAFLRVSHRLVPPANDEMRARYAERLANLTRSLGRHRLAEVSMVDGAAAQERWEQARAYLLEAGDHYLELAGLVALDGSRSSQAIWDAAEAFDAAGARTRAAEVLEAFVRERPQDPRTPRALLRLGQTWQAAGDYEQAVKYYLRNTREFPTTPSAAASLVPLADCYAELGDSEKAVQTLLRIVDRDPDDAIRQMVPIAREYRDALFRLGDLCRTTGEHEKAIARYQEAIERYPDDPRTDRAYFMLAEANRLSADSIYQSMGRKENVAYVDDLRERYRRRLRRAHDLYVQVIDRYRAAPPSRTAPLDELYVKLSYFRKADTIYDLSRVHEPAEPALFSEAAEAYDRAAWVYQKDPMAMSAYVQMINCYLRLGDMRKARMTLERARWALKQIDDEAFASDASSEGRGYWEDYWSWLASTPVFTPMNVDERNS